MRPSKKGLANFNDTTDAPRLHLDTVEPGLNMSQYDNWFKSDRIASGRFKYLAKLCFPLTEIQEHQLAFGVLHLGVDRVSTL